MSSPVRYECHGNVGLILVDNPPVNALSSAVRQGLLDALAQGVADQGVTALVVAGAGRTFIAGADISEFGSPRAMTPDLNAVIAAFEDSAKPVVAGIHGTALGGGLEVALACDLRVASETARLGVPEILLGVFPGAGGTQRLPRVIGASKAKEMIWSGRQVKPDEALALGLADRVVSAEGYLDAALDWAAELGRGAVVAMGLSKLAVNGGIDCPLDAGLDLEREKFNEVMTTEDATTGISSFLEHGPGKATFAGR